LRSGNSNVTGVPARLQVKWFGSEEWVDLEDVVTDSKGVASAGATYPTAGWFRFAFDGDQTRTGSVSADVFVKVPTKVAAGAARHEVAATLQTVTGARVTGAALTLQRRAAGTTRWVSVAKVRTDRRGTVVKHVRPPRSSYYRWVFSGESRHLGALSPRLTVRR
jgi:hypothetical protein